jgi:hypothetical protein
MRIPQSILTVVLALSATLASAADVTGTWKMAVETPSGTGEPSFILKQEGATVTGTYKGPLGEAPVTGTIKENELTMGYEISASGMDLEVKYIGIVDGNSISGKVSLGAMGDGTFKGTKQ